MAISRTDFIVSTSADFGAIANAFKAAIDSTGRYGTTSVDSDTNTVTIQYGEYTYATVQFNLSSSGWVQFITTLPTSGGTNLTYTASSVYVQRLSIITVGSTVCVSLTASWTLSHIFGAAKDGTPVATLSYYSSNSWYSSVVGYMSSVANTFYASTETSRNIDNVIITRAVYGYHNGNSIVPQGISYISTCPSWVISPWNSSYYIAPIECYIDGTSCITDGFHVISDVG